MKQKLVKYEVKDNIATVQLDNPPLNVLSTKLKQDLWDCLQEISSRPDIRVLILTGAGDRAFMVGADIKEFSNFMEPGKAKESSLASHKTFCLLESMPIPTIAAINGLALGGGCELALCCDIRIAAENVQLGLPEINLGLFPGAGGTQRLARLLGPSAAKELMFTGKTIDATKAYVMGLVNKVVPKGKAYSEALKLAQELSQKPGAALELIKKAVNQGIEKTLHEGLELEADLIDQVFLTEDIKEGVAAFIEKRKPCFKHR